MSDVDSRFEPTAFPGGRGPALSAVRRAADALACSSEPEVVFESLVKVCAPMVCEAASVTVCAADDVFFAIWPPVRGLRRSPYDDVVTEFDAPACGECPGYRGVVTFGFRAAHEGQELAVQLLVERAMANVERERLAEAVASRQVAVDHLELALTSNREIGVAVGILMANHKITDKQAFDLLSRESQRRNRKVRVIAQEVAETGVLELPPAVAVVVPGGRARPRLSSVPVRGHD